MGDQCDNEKEAMKKYCNAIEVSEACLERHAQTPQAHYHIGVAHCQLALKLLKTNVPAFEDFRIRAARGLKEARDSALGQRRLRDSTEAITGAPIRLRLPPWLPIDDLMVEAVAAKPVEDGFGSVKPIELPLSIGWHVRNWRT